MKTEYGYRDSVSDWWPAHLDRDGIEKMCRKYGMTMIARDISEPRIVSIR